MERSLFEEEHEMFRKAFRTFLERELVPHREEWEAAGVIDREVFAKAGASGFLAMSVPEKFGGAGVDDFRYNLIIAEEICAADVYPAGLGMTLHSDVCLPYFLDYCNEEQQSRWLPGIASGELITAVAM
ncbi:MAG: acyl-CoA dehydrogenase, partial [Actinobacteria bacterium]|nr:acyl-CoA dehydrogenase [Actinomycetota bacterium]